jgi:SH3-like domain-containing protein
MKRAFPAVFLVLLMAISYLSAAPASAGEYVVMLSRNINIRTGPGTDRVVVGRAWKGDMFNLTGETGNWWRIEMFSGDTRYISKSWAAKLTEPQIVPGHGMRLPSDVGAQKALHRDIGSARARARGEAEEIVSVSLDAERNANLERILEDRFILEIFSIHSVNPAMFARLMDEAEDEEW